MMSWTIRREIEFMKFLNGRDTRTMVHNYLVIFKESCRYAFGRGLGGVRGVCMVLRAKFALEMELMCMEHMHGKDYARTFFWMIPKFIRKNLDYNYL